MSFGIGIQNAYKWVDFRVGDRRGLFLQDGLNLPVQ